ncbi:hypothetical protein FOZ60_002956 [Perkinsus olseni]|uniref:Uncharacterized protein n=1 Tax=Perkinsus olseni TaxID=32597 RepID=A0A7J6NXI2_PEROL|nr:hypothetical protein FOZ60_002956 [Perkinsus olseni]
MFGSYYSLPEGPQRVALIAWPTADRRSMINLEPLESPTCTWLHTSMTRRPSESCSSTQYLRFDKSFTTPEFRKCADPNKQDMSLVTPLHAACQQPNSCDVVRTLLRHRADVLERDSIGHTPLHWAAFACETDTVKLLLSVDGGSVAARLEDVTRSTPLDIAERRRCEPICRELKRTLRATEMTRPASAVITQEHRDRIIVARRSRERMRKSMVSWRPRRDWRPTSTILRCKTT